MRTKENKTIAFATRSMNRRLFELCNSLLGQNDCEHYRIEGTEADEYFYKLLTLDEDWIVNIDEDAFVTNPERLFSMLNFMEENNYVCSGMPDGGVCSHRFHNPVVPNAFFNIINIAAIRDEFSLIEARPLVHTSEYEKTLPRELLRTKYEYDNFEPYYPFFYWLLKREKKILYQDALDWNRDTTSTVLLDQEKKPLLIHCWYSRVFDDQPERFIKTAEFAKSVQNSLKSKK